MTTTHLPPVSHGSLVGEVVGHVPGSTLSLGASMRVLPDAATVALPAHPHPFTSLRDLLRRPTAEVSDREAAQLLAWLDARAKDADALRQIRDMLGMMRSCLRPAADLLEHPVPRPVELKAVIVSLRDMATLIDRALGEVAP